MDNSNSNEKKKDTKLEKKYQKTKRNSDGPKFDLGPLREVLNEVKNKDKK